METAPIAAEVKYQDILNENDEAIFLLDAILMMAPQIEDAEQTNALTTVAHIAKRHLKKVEQLIDAVRKESKK
ncbi:hypothetical protein WH297_19235 [Ochrobactrum vermis]|uniref:Phage protein n=1 Tax=Ochrobactrum vermis TaxID=1827297 RepID=A0ABU8PJV7_9HYPH|nr:hypothetical protein [Ochrobactrum vermis]